MMEYAEILKLLALGVTAGILAGLFGIGGGLVIVPILVLVFGFEPKMAVGTSLFVILLPTGLLGVLEHWRNGNVRGYAGLCIAAGVFLGAYAGAVVANSMSQITMKRLYAVFLLVVGAYFLLAPSATNRSRAETAAKPVPPEAIDAGH
jgi:uncharacterized membrane protein YfcA